MKTRESVVLDDVLDSADTSASISNVRYWKNASWNAYSAERTNETVQIRDEDNTTFEIGVASATGGTVTFSKRGLDASDTKTEVASNKLDRRPWAIIEVISSASDFIDLDSNNTFTWENHFTGGKYTQFATTSARDTALWADWAATEPWTGVYCDDTGLHYNYNLSTNQRESVETGTTTPNADTSTTGKTRLAEQAQHDAWTTTESWNPLVPQSDVIQTWLQKWSATYASTVTSVYTPAFLTGWSSAQSNFATWAAVTDGSFRVTVDWTAYNVDWINFTGDASMADVASTIQTALRTATSWTETVVWSTDHFVITSWDTTVNSEISVLTTSTWTVWTDISWVWTAWMDAESGQWTATAAVHASYTLNFTPAIASLTAWMSFRFEPAVTNDWACDITIEALTTKDFKTLAWDELQAWDIPANSTVIATYNGTNFEYQGLVQAWEDRIWWVEDASQSETDNWTAWKHPDSEKIKATYEREFFITNDTQLTSDSSGAVTYAHWLSKTPKFVEVVCVWSGTSAVNSSPIKWWYDGTNTRAIGTFDAWSTLEYTVSTSNIINAIFDSSNNWWTATCWVDATNITLTFTKSGTPPQNLLIIIKAEA